MKTENKYSTTLGILDAEITVAAEIDKRDKYQYNQLIIELCQRTDGAFFQEIKIPCVSKEEILELANNIKKLAKHFPVDGD